MLHRTGIYNAIVIGARYDMKYLVLVLMCLNLIGCADGQGIEAISSDDNGFTLVDSNYQQTCQAPQAVTTQCMSICNNQYVIKDSYPGIRSVYTSQSNCQSNTGVVHQESIAWINPSRG